MEKVTVIILAVGLGKRMGGDSPKVAVTTDEKPLILHVLSTVQDLDPTIVVPVVGHKKEIVEGIIAKGLNASLKERVITAVQLEQKGTGHAAKCGAEQLGDFSGTVLILYGDVPLVRAQTLRNLIAFHEGAKSTLSFVSLITDRQNDYGRVVRDAKGEVQKIVELKDCGPAEAHVREFNSGIYAVDSAFLRPALEGLKNDNAQQEYYLTDIVRTAVQEGQRVTAFQSTDFEEVQGVNDRADLALINTVLNRRRIQALMQAGVIVRDPATFFVDPAVTIEPGADIGPSVQLRGATKVAAGVKMEGTVYLLNTEVHRDAHLKLGVRAEGAVIGPRASIGPFAHLREESLIGEDARIGNFVETKKTTVGKGAKASHLTYLGDCTIGEDTNIGAGTITCNYDGYSKSKTVIGKNAFIGSDTCLVAPVTVEDGATIGAGSVITRTVEKDSLALTRAPQVSKPGWAARKREEMGNQKKGH